MDPAPTVARNPIVKTLLNVSALVVLTAVVAGSASAATPKISYTDPAWSHDGRRIVVVGRESSGKTDLYVITLRRRLRVGPFGLTLRGSSRRLGVGPFVRTPTWSPDDRRIAYQSADGISDVNADGRGARSVTKDNGYTPSWSPGGRRIAFAWSNETSGSQIYVVNPDGSGRRVMARPTVYRSFVSPTWSPDGEQIAFFVEDAPDSATQPSLLGIIRDFGGRTRYLLRGREPVQPAWSPTGQAIAFSERYARISVIDLRTNRVTRLRLGRGPTWSPDGKRIAFSRAGDIYEMNTDGSKLATVTK